MEENIILEILHKVDMIANQMNVMQGQMNVMQNQINGMQGQMNSMQNQIDGMQGQMNGMQDQMNNMQDQINGLQGQVSKIEVKLDEVAEDTKFAKNTCLSILEYLEQEEELTDRINETTKDHEKRICMLENRKFEVVPIV